MRDLREQVERSKHCPGRHRPCYINCVSGSEMGCVCMCVFTACDSRDDGVPSEAEDSCSSRSGGRFRPQQDQRAAGRWWWDTAGTLQYTSYTHGPSSSNQLASLFFCLFMCAVIQKVDYVFAENGLEAYRHGQFLSVQVRLTWWVQSTHFFPKALSCFIKIFVRWIKEVFLS